MQIYCINLLQEKPTCLRITLIYYQPIPMFDCSLSWQASHLMQSLRI